VSGVPSPSGPILPPPPEDDGTIARMVFVVGAASAGLYGVVLLADFFGFQYFAGKFSLVLFLAGSIWCFGFLLLRTANQAASESYDLDRAALLAQHPDAAGEADSPIGRVSRQYEDLARRHDAISRVRSYSAALAVYGTACAAIASATVLVGIPGFWGLFDFLAILFLLGSLVIHVLGPRELTLLRPLTPILPARWQ
jgi:hypothetical protein